MSRKKAYPALLPPMMVSDAVRVALAEDLGLAGDLTTQATIAPDATAVAVMNAREDGIIAGMDLARAAFAEIGPGLVFEPFVTDGAHVKAGAKIAEISGNARLILSAERVALNFLMRLCGIATHTGRFVEAIGDSHAHVCDTRKTTPGLRAFEKYAVRCGGGHNHRYGLDDAILIKDNHIAVAGGVRQVIEATRAFAGHLVSVEIEVDNLDKLEEALDADADAVLLDNMDAATLKKAVAINKGRAKLEASGGVDLDTIGAIAKTGVDYISTSKITMAAPPLDIGLDIDIRA